MSDSVTAIETMTLREVAAYLRLSEGAVRRLIECYGLPHQRLDEELHFLKGPIDEWRSRRGTTALVTPGAASWTDDPFFDDMMQFIERHRGPIEPEKA